MCGLCGVFGSEHWAETDGGTRARVLRAALLDRVLAHAGLGLQEWAGRYVVRDRKGSALVVDDLPGVWAAVERLAGRALDPLDPALVATLA
jgi:hypothetical protein